MRKKVHTHPILFAVIFCLVALLAGSQRAQATLENVQDKNGPALGDTIDLSSWRTRDGRTLEKVNQGHSLAMILLVNPSCGTCASAKENFRTLRERAGKPGIPYYVLMIPDSSDVQKYFSYADTLKLGAESFVWANAEAKPLTSLVTMAVPSHLLVTNEGLIVEKWPGTTPNE
jgi:hypothetical protein